MLKKSAAALLLSTTIMAGTALAQTSPATAPSGGGSSATTTSSSGAGTSGQFLTEQSKDQFRASKFVGLSIYGPDNQRVGDINEILIDQSGSAKAVVIGVGGFLGIGEKDVAIPYDQVKFTDQPVTGGGTGGNSSATTTAATGNGVAPAAPAMTMSVGNTANGTPVTPPPAGATAGAGSGSARSKAYPDHGMIDMTADQLKSAPTFKFAS